MSEPKCLVMLASYNGEKYIRKQIESILDQTYSNFDLLIRDDGSSDITVQIVEEYQNKDSRVKLIKNTSDLHGAYHNFHELILAAKSMQPYDYYLFSDQDDVWIKTKIEKLVAYMEGLGNQKPAMVYTDLAVIDGEDNLIAKSMSSNLGLDLSGKFMSEFFIHAYVWGCASILNKKLFELVPALNKSVKQRSIISHDNYYAKCAVAFGKLYFYNEPLIKHRRHGDNVSESHQLSMSPMEILKRGTVGLKNLAWKHSRVYAQTLFTVKYLRAHGLDVPILSEVERVINKGGIVGIRFFIKHEIKRQQKSKTIGLYLVMFTKMYKKYLKNT